MTRILAACEDPNSTAHTFEKIIECDPVLSVRLLRMANSPIYGLGRKIEGITISLNVNSRRLDKPMRVAVDANSQR